MHQHFSTPRRKDMAGGLLMIMIGLAAAIVAWGYRVGTPSAMGPGFFPASVGAVMALSGLAMIVKAGLEPDTKPVAPPARAEWRGWICIVVSVIAFIVLGQHAGLVLATFAVVFISALGDRQNSFLTALLLALAICTIAVVVFWWLLQVQFPLFPWS